MVLRYNLMGWAAGPAVRPRSKEMQVSQLTVVDFQKLEGQDSRIISAQGIKGHLNLNSGPFQFLSCIPIRKLADCRYRR